MRSQAAGVITGSGKGGSARMGKTRPTWPLERAQ
jgi:hypothetical protein